MCVIVIVCIFIADTYIYKYENCRFFISTLQHYTALQHRTPLHCNTVHLPTMSNTSPKRKQKIQPRPTIIRNELRRTCALRGYSDMKTGVKKKHTDQHKFMSRFFHGKVPTHPAQIQLLAEGRQKYRDLFDVVDVQTTSKRTKEASSVQKLVLKKKLSRDQSRSYYSDVDIRAEDLEKKNKTGVVLVTGRNLHDLASKGLKYYKKALAFNEAVWDSELMCEKDSGHSIEDCIEHVRRQMYLTEKVTKEEDDLSVPEEEDTELHNNDNDIEKK